MSTSPKEDGFLLNFLEAQGDTSGRHVTWVMTRSRVNGAIVLTQVYKVALEPGQAHGPTARDAIAMYRANLTAEDCGGPLHPDRNLRLMAGVKATPATACDGCRDFDECQERGCDALLLAAGRELDEYARKGRVALDAIRTESGEARDLGVMSAPAPLSVPYSFLPPTHGARNMGHVPMACTEKVHHFNSGECVCACGTLATTAPGSTCTGSEGAESAEEMEAQRPRGDCWVCGSTSCDCYRYLSLKGRKIAQEFTASLYRTVEEQGALERANVSAASPHRFGGVL